MVVSDRLGGPFYLGQEMEAWACGQAATGLYRAWRNLYAEQMSKEVSAARSNAGNTHIAGEMFVAAELAKRGYSVSLTMGNAEAVDLFAERNGTAICIQVKAIAHKRNVGWPLPFDKSKIIDKVPYVCVVLNEIGQAPTYYILPPNEVRERGRWYATRAILDIGRVKAGDFENAWHLIDEALKGPDSLVEGAT